MIAAVTGGRAHWPSLGSLELLAGELANRGVSELVDGDCPTGVDRVARGFVRARGLCGVRWVSAEWKRLGPAAGPIRNRRMLSGLVAGQREHPRVDVLFAFAGGSGTKDCVDAAGELEIPVIPIRTVREPTIWNRHAGKPPGRAVYIGLGSPLGNPFPAEQAEGETRADAAPRVLGLYRRWLWARLHGPERDPAVVAALAAIEPGDFLVCSCWPRHCHGEVVVRAWRHLRAAARAA